MAYDGTKPANNSSLVSADIRENFRALKEDGIVVPADNSVVEAKIGTGAVTEGKIGTGAVTEGRIGAGAVSQAKLKTSVGEIYYQRAVGTESGETILSLPGGEYGFWPRTAFTAINNSESNTYTDVQMQLFKYGFNPMTRYTQYSSSYISCVSVTITKSSSYINAVGYIYQRYVTSSGEVFWIYILRNKETKEIKSTWLAPDHPCFGNGGKPNLVPHPFPDFNSDVDEVIVINPSREQLAAMENRRFVDDDDIPDLSLIEVIQQFYEIDEESNPPWPTKEVTVGLPTGHDWSNMAGDMVVPIKKAIPQPDGILVKSLREKEG